MKKEKKLRRFTADFKVHKGALVYDQRRKFENSLTTFKTDNEGLWCLMTIESIDKVRYYFHQYYRGYILDVLAQDKDIKEHYRLHLNLKKDLLTEKIPGGMWDVIPNKYMEKGIAIVPKDKLFEVSIPSGRSIVLTVEDKPVEIIPSHAALNNEQMKFFIEKCEDIRDNMFDWRPSDEALEMRTHIFGDKGQGKLWNE